LSHGGVALVGSPRLWSVSDCVALAPLSVFALTPLLFSNKILTFPRPPRRPRGRSRGAARAAADESRGGDSISAGQAMTKQQQRRRWKDGEERCGGSPSPPRVEGSCCCCSIPSAGRARLARRSGGASREEKGRRRKKERKKVKFEGKKSAMPLSTLFFARPLPLPLGAFFVFEGCCRDDSDQWFCRIAGS